MRILLAVSGGIDSMYLANRAPELFPGASFAVAHCNFRLRGAESDSDEAFVREWCAEHGVEFITTSFDTAEYAAREGISIEMAARDLRYGWFARICRERGFDALATAHNANDNAETLMLNLLRGTGSKGLRGMARESVLPCPPAACPAKLPLRSIPPTDFVSGPLPLTRPGVDTVLPGQLLPSPRRSAAARLPGGVTGAEPPSKENSSVKLLRPLLGTSREAIEKWMTGHGLQWHEDRTNAESEYKRNKIRNCVFPLFREINPSFIQTLGADMRRFAQVDDIAEDYYQEALGKGIYNAAEGSISVPALLALKHWQYVLWRLLEGCGFSQQTFEKLVELLQRYKTGPMGTVTLSGKTFQSPTHSIVAVGRKLRIVSSPNP
ncbi:MAG: tRNA lysidine(34) synthetase TilS [Bacteroidales bacterium]|nr:tRNA lysidine(34) synthetase TilS [Bacteroidales bacterium]